jgi:hypothetical protein
MAEYEQYLKVCDDEDCGCVLDIDCPIMCYDDGISEKTLCTTCYWDNEYYITDKNEDNEEEIVEYKKDKKMNDGD